MPRKTSKKKVSASRKVKIKTNTAVISPSGAGEKIDIPLPKLVRQKSGEPLPILELPKAAVKSYTKNGKKYTYKKIKGKDVKQYNKDYNKKWRTENPNGKYSRISITQILIDEAQKLREEGSSIASLVTKYGIYWEKMKLIIDGKLEPTD